MKREYKALGGFGTLGLEIADVDTENNLLLIKGSVPGHRNSIVEIRNDAK